MFELIYRYDPAVPSERRQPSDAEDARRTLEAGNRDFASLATGANGTRVILCNLEDLGIAPQGGVPRQGPFAVVLGCSDARVPIELIFDRACNEIFVVRVAGNILGQEQLGSIDYAVTHLGTNLKLLVVLGHSRCGAVSAAVDAFLRPGDYLGLLSNHHLRAIINDLLPAVRASVAALDTIWGKDIKNHPNFTAALVECAVVINAALTASILHAEFHERARKVRSVFGVYDLESRRVQVPHPDDAVAEPRIRLVDTPTDFESFRTLAAEVAGSSTMRALLGG